jgi:hypothetical protein
MKVAGAILRYRRPGTRCGRPPRRARTGGPAHSGPHQRTRALSKRSHYLELTRTPSLSGFAAAPALS